MGPSGFLGPVPSRPVPGPSRDIPGRDSPGANTTTYHQKYKHYSPIEIQVRKLKYKSFLLLILW